MKRRESECPRHPDALECAHRDGYAAALIRDGVRYRVAVTDRQGEMVLPGSMSLERGRSAIEAWMEASGTEWTCQSGT